MAFVQPWKTKVSISTFSFKKSHIGTWNLFSISFLQLTWLACAVPSWEDFHYSELKTKGNQRSHKIVIVGFFFIFFFGRGGSGAKLKSLCNS